MNKFKAGQNLSDRSICNSECIFTATVVKRTAKRVTLDTDMDGIKTVGIQIDDNGNEWCYPYGRYSMAATFNAPADDEITEADLIAMNKGFANPPKIVMKRFADVEPVDLWAESAAKFI